MIHKHGKISAVSAFLIVALLTFLSCEDEDGDETKISRNNSDESHRTGQNCMDCHYPGGTGEGWFTIAGTVYDSTKVNPLPNVSVELYTQPRGNGELKHVIEVDALGNFYSTENIDFDNDLYVSVQGNQEIRDMISALPDGACNACHGNSQDVVWTR